MEIENMDEFLELYEKPEEVDRHVREVFKKSNCLSP